MDEDAYPELCAYTLTHGAPTFVHQYVVDAYAAQHATPQTKAIQLTFALVGLYLHLEKGFTGREVQRAHMALARRTRSWPSFNLPSHRGTVTAGDVMAVPAGPERDEAIDAWSASVWDAYADAKPAVIALLERHGIV